ncbi:MAG: TorF family putative porin, partial [Candidatus Aminicenantales bacterium]
MNKTRFRAAAAAAVLGILLGALPLAAQWEFQADVNSRYIWRGFDLLWNNKPALQPSVTYTFGESGLSANLWGSFALSDRSMYKDLDEIDLTLDYAFALSDRAEMSVGFIAYTYPFWPGFTFKNEVTEEFYVSAGLPEVFLSPTLTAYYDVNLGTGLYVLLEGSHSIPLSEALGLDLSAGLGYNNKLYIDDSGLSDLTLGASLPIKLGNWTIAPRVNYTFVFLESVNDENEFWFGISLIR